MKIASAASAIPKHRYAQGVITEALKFHWAEKLERPGVLERLHTRTGVHYRHLAFSFEEYKRLETWGGRPTPPGSRSHRTLARPRSTLLWSVRSSSDNAIRCFPQFHSPAERR